MAHLRDQLQITRINRMKRRVAAWWRYAHCACLACVVRRGGEADAATLFRLVEAAPGDLDLFGTGAGEHSSAPKAH